MTETPMPESTVRRYTRKPLDADALQWTGKNADAMAAFLGSHFDYDPEADGEECASVLTSKHSTWQYVYPSWWALLASGGVVMVMNDADFTATFKAVDRG